jgi:hypothetical protein
VANGERILCLGVIRQAPIIIAAERFLVDLFVMPLAGYDLVLGKQWLITLGQIMWDFTARTMSFTRHCREVCWTDMATVRAPCLVATAAGDSLIDGLLSTFADVFAAPIGLPPVCARDHAIILKPDAAPVAVRPYRYPTAHKDKLERQCAEMMG